METPHESKEEKKSATGDTIRTHHIHMHQSHVHEHQQHNHKQDKFNLKRAQYLASQGKYKKAIQALESQGLCPNTIKYRQIFKSKLEPANDTITLPQVHANTMIKFQFDLKHIKSITKSLDHTTGAGTDALKIQYLKQVISNTDDIPELLSNIATFFNKMANGELPRIIANHMRHSRAISGKKLKFEHLEKNKIKYDDITQRYYETPFVTKEDVRPITIQNGWIRLCNRLIFSSNRSLTKQLCLEKQIGIGCPSGAQALIAAAKIGINMIKKDTNKAMMKLDFRNCYNTIDRQKVINIVNQLAPELTSLYYQRYKEPYMLVHSDGTRDIFENGMAQGCSLSTAALGAIQKDAEPKITRNCRDIKPDWKLNISGKYHDDATDVANIDDLLLYFQESSKIYKEYGMEFTPTKSELIINRNVRIDQLPPIFQQFIISIEEVEILGIPIGDIDYMNENVIFKLLKARQKLQTIKSFDSDKTKTDMIRKFNGTSKLMYLFSNIEYNSNETEYKKELKKLDEDKIMTAVETALTTTQREQLELPVQMTGIGIGGMTDIIPAMVLSNYP